MLASGLPQWLYGLTLPVTEIAGSLPLSSCSVCAACPCNNQTCINAVLDANFLTSPNGLVGPDLPAQGGSTGGFFGPLTVTDSPGAVNTRTITAKNLPGIAVTTKGKLPPHLALWPGGTLATSNSVKSMAVKMC